MRLPRTSCECCELPEVRLGDGTYAAEDPAVSRSSTWTTPGGADRSCSER